MTTPPALTPPPTMACPKCGAVEPDYDGLGVLYCEKCGHCEHASLTERRCDFCNEEQP